MNLLILGGTGFVGRYIVESVLAGGHSVSVLARGTTGDELPLEVERLYGDRDLGIAGLQALTGRRWNICVDVSGYTPRQVRPSVELLQTSVQRYVFVSAVRVYRDPAANERPVRETHPRLQPASEEVTDIDDDTYGTLKVTCENIVLEAYADRCTILRPQVVGGCYDPVDRLSYWVRRAMLGGEMLAPGDGSDYLQFIDAGDLGRFTQRVIENDLSGTFNLAGTRFTWKEFMTILGAQNLVWVNAQIIKSANLAINEIPLYRPEGSPRSGLMDICNEQAIRAGLTLTDPSITIKRIREWVGESDLVAALSSERELELITMAKEATNLSNPS